MLRFVCFVALALGAALTLGVARPLGASAGLIAPGIRTDSHRVQAGTPIKHVVIVVQENRTIDDLFNGFPGADTVTIDPYTGTTLQPLSMGSHCDAPHFHTDFVNEFDNGKMDGFSHGNGFICNTYSYVPPTETSYYWGLARDNVLADETFQSFSGPSYPAHQYLFAGRSCSYPADHYCLAENPGLPVDQYYCGGTDPVANIDMNTPYPGDESHFSIPCKLYTVTILDELARAHLSWRYYTSDYRGLWAGPSSDARCVATPLCISNLITDPNRFLKDVAKGRLANVAFVTPTPENSDHNNMIKNPLAGQQWVQSVVDAVQKSSYKDSTTILVTWDDWGGWYDHVIPPTPPFYNDPYEYGFRVPLLVVSPYVTPGTVDHTVRNVYGSMLRYVETTFELQSLHQIDDPSLTDDLTSLFHYSATTCHGRSCRHGR